MIGSDSLNRDSDQTAVWSETLQGTLWLAKETKRLQVHSEDFVDAQADPSSRDMNLTITIIYTVFSYCIPNISPVASRRLYFVTVAFPGYLHYIIIIFFLIFPKTFSS